MSSLQTKVSVYQDGELIHEQVVDSGEYVLDQTGALQPKPKEQPVAGTHTVLGIEGQQWTIGNGGGLEQTLVDGETIAVPTIILPGQKLRVGDKEIEIHPALTEEVRAGVTVRLPTSEEITSPHRYSAGRKIAKGGMGVIMMAHDRILERDVAMKLMIDGSNPEAVARFYQEAQITAQLEHPNIVPVHELRIDEKGQPFYTMKLVRGVSLKRILERLAGGEEEAIRRWPLSALLTVFQKICDAIAFAHARGVIHRDLKPDNIMLGQYGEAQAMDWGLAKRLGQASLTGAHAEMLPDDSTESTGGGKSTIEPTMSGTVIGTPQYMSPEQASGAIEMLDEHTDIYSLGAILYYILALRPPYNGRTAAEVMRHVRQGKAVPLEEAGEKIRLPHISDGRVPDSLAAVCRKAMAVAKADRYAEVKALQNDIEAYQTGFATSAESAGLWKLANLFFRRHRTVSIAAATVLVAGVVFAINLARERDRAQSASVEAMAARRIADQQRDVAEDQLYFSEMLQAGRHLADGRPESARELLDRHRSETSGRDLRGWEWFYLTGEANQDRLRTHAHNGGVFAVAVGADGRRIATGGGDGEVGIWKTRGLMPEFRLRGSGSPVLAVAWHSGGKWLATGANDGLVQVWDLETRKPVAQYQLESANAVRSLGWQPHDGGIPTLAIGSLDRAILLWRWPDGLKAEEPKVFVQTRNGVGGLHWSADGRRLAAAELSTFDTVEVFEVATKRRVLANNTTAGNDAFTVAIDPTGKRAAAGSKHLTVVVYELDPGPAPEKPPLARKPEFSEALHRGFVSALAWSPDGRYLGSASHDGTIRISLISKDQPSTQILSGHEGEVNALAWTNLPTADGSESGNSALFSGGADGTLRAWNPASTGEIRLKGNNWISGSQWSPDGTQLAGINFRDAVYVADPSSGLSVPLDTALGTLFDVAWSPAGERLATASRSRSAVEILDARSGRGLGIFHLPNVDRVAWSPSGRYLAACGVGGARVWDTKTGALAVVISKPGGSVLWHADERRILLGCDDGAIEVWDVFSGKLLTTWREASDLRSNSVESETEPPRRVFDLEWSPDQRLLAFVTQDGVAGLMDGTNGRLVRTFDSQTSGIWRVVWNADGTRLATVGQGGAMRIYDTAAGGQVAQINHGLGKAELLGLDWTRDGRRLVTGGFDLRVRLWDALRGQRIDAVEKLAPLVSTRGAVGALKNLALQYAELGWVDLARATLRAARERAPSDPELEKATADAEARFDRALDLPSFDDNPAYVQNREKLKLLGAIHDAWEEGKGEPALKAWRELIRLPGSEEVRPLAETYFSRAQWSATWFTSKVDPATDLEAWRGLSAAAEAVTVNVRTLCFPYLRRGPNQLLVDPNLTSRGPGAKNFGMLARATITLPEGEWRIRVIGGGGVRVVVNGRAVLEQWSEDGPAEREAIFRQATTGDAEIKVEHFVREGTADFQFRIGPVAE